MARFASFLLVSAVLVTAAVGQVVSPVGFQSWACRTPLQTSMDVNRAAAATPAALGPNLASEPVVAAGAALAATKFLYNVFWGPPNFYIATSTGGPSQTDFVMLNFPTTTPAWTATIPTGTAANGYPFGCCGGVGAVTVAELGCRNCISGTLALPTLSTDPVAIFTNQVVQCNGQQGAPSISCMSSSYVPGAMQSQAGGTLTDTITTGTGVTTLAFPSQSNSVLAAGIYSFQLWATSICGFAQSATVFLAARCPPSPTVSAVLREVPSATGNPSNVLQANTDGSYTVTVGATMLADASCSYPYQINKPNWPAQQQNTPLPAGNSAAATFNPTRNLYAIQRVYFSVANPTMTSIMVGGNPQANFAAAATAATFTATPILDQWAVPVRFNTAGTHMVVITATDGCSAGQGIITVHANCTCQPVAKAMYVPTLWSNAVQVANPTSMLQNTVATAAGLTSGLTGPTAVNGVPLNVVAYTLTASAFDYEVLQNNANLAYDWSFVYWVPDYSPVFTKASQAPQNLAQLYLPSTAPGTATTPTSTFPPSTGAQCSPSTGVVPYACQQGLFANIQASPTGASPCCFAQRDIVTDLSTVARPARGSYLYKVLQVVSNFNMTARNTVGTITKVYNFMRISSGCTAGAAGGSDWTSTVNATSSSADPAMYYALPLYLQYVSTGVYNGQMSGAQTYNDFNGFPNVNTATPGTGAAPFRPTTECGAWLKTVQVATTYTQVQTRVNTTVSCGRNTDLVLCRVTISQTAFNAATASLSVSSFGACKGQWQFVLTVEDTCQSNTDYFIVNVGCNRAPVVSAGCTNTQTWTQGKFEQISLDGRASYDPDNFGDQFYGLPSRGDTFPGCQNTANACSNGGLGLYGLTYAWALLNFFNPQGQLVYPTVSAGGNITGCPTTATNMQLPCEMSYCSNTPWSYPFVDPLTRQYTLTSFLRSAAGATFGPSIQGNLQLGQAWQMGFYAVEPILPGMNGANMMPLVDAAGSTMTMQMVFPDFNAACAPTVIPMFYDTATQTTSNNAMFSATLDWAYAQQIKHVGNSAYMAGLTMAGMYTARLYAFDGCSVGHADVSFTLECPTMSFATTSVTAAAWNLTTSYSTADSPSYTPPAFNINYAGTQEITVSGTIQVYSFVNGAPDMSVVYSSCSMTQQGTVVAKDVPVSSRTMNVGNCQNLLNPNNVWLSAGTYVMVATVTDGCQRGFAITAQSPSFTIVCQNIVLNSFGAFMDNTLGSTAIGRALTYIPPGGAGPATAIAGSFPNFSFNMSAEARIGNTGNMFSQVAVTWTVYWRPSSTAAAPDNSNTGGASGAFNGFLTGTGAPVPNVFAVYQGGSNNVQGGIGTSVPSGQIANANIPGGLRTITFQNSNPLTLGARTSTDTNTGLNYNTVTSTGQASFLTGTRSQVAINWAGDYYVRVTASSANSCNVTGALTASAADQYFRVTCPATNDVGSVVTSTDLAWISGGNPIFAASFFNSVPYQTGNNYCQTASDPYCANGAGGSGMFKKFTLSLTSSTNAVVNGQASSVSYRISYRLPYAMAPNVTNALANSALTVNFVSVYQNPLLISPFAFLNIPTAASAVTMAWSGNAASQQVSLNMPGTWSINIFNTNGCTNITSATRLDFGAFCYDAQMPEATFSFTVRPRPPPGGCAVPIANDANNCDGSSQVTLCSNVAIVRGPLLLADNSATYIRRRLVVEDAEEVAPADASASSSSSRRKLLQQGVTTGVCANNGQSIAAGSLGTGFTSPQGTQVGATYNFATTQTLSPNYGAFVTVYFNSYDITPAYYPSASDLRNFYGMGDLFGDQKLQFGVGNLGAITYQGAFDTLIVAIDSTRSTIRVPQNPNTNNQIVNWLNLQNWNNFYTQGSGSAPSWTTPTLPAGTQTPAGYATQCSWAPIGTLNPVAASGFNNGANSYNAMTDVPMALVGCSPLGNSGAALSSAAIQTAANSASAGVDSSTTPPRLIISHRGTDTPAYAGPSDLFSLQVGNAGYTGRVATKAGNYDFQAIAWNGPVGKSCYDYRAVRVIATCNRLVPFDPTNPSSTSNFRTSTTEGPLLIASLVSSPSTISRGAGANAAIPAIAVGWKSGMFDGVNITAGFKYLQCGTAAAAGTGGSDPANMPCGSAPGSRDGEGNYHSLQYTWSVVSAPTTSIYNVATTNVSFSAITFGNIEVVNTTVNNADPDRVVTTTVSTRTNTWTQTTVNRQIRLLNHGYRNPLTSIHPDVEGTYTVQLTIADGCSVWQSGTVSITSSCAVMTPQQLAFSTLVTARIGSNTLAAATTLPANVPAGSTVLAASIDGSQFSRITLSASMPANSDYYYTYSWSVSRIQTGGNVALATTNMQGTVASFVPTDLLDNAAATSNQLIMVTLTIFTGCMTAAGTPQSFTSVGYITVQCTLPVTTSNFQFYAPFVNTYNPTPQNFFGFSTTVGATNSTFANVKQNGVNYNLYYRQNFALQLQSNTVANVGSLPSCNPNGPYCGPTSIVGAPANIPTILFAGSVPQGSGTNSQPDNTAYFNTLGANTAGTVWGAGWQQLYFNVPVSMTANVCKIKSTYWVLTGYQNALPFVPAYVPVSTPTQVTTCSPAQAWSWTVISTPCTTCSCSTGTTCSEAGSDICDFTDFYPFQYKLQTVSVSGGNQITRPNTGYVPPTFNQINTGTNGANMNAYCVYDSGNRLDGLPNIDNLRANCRTSGRGLSVNILQTGSCSTAGQPSGASGGTSTACPMANIAFVPGFPGAYGLQLAVADGCGAPVMQTVTVNAQCRVKPTVTPIQQSITTYYDCADQTAQSNWGNPNVNSATPLAGKFDPITMSTLIAPANIGSINDSFVAPTVRTTTCSVNVPKATMNCTDVKNYVNSQNVMVDSSDNSGNKFKACCTCLYGTQTINLFSGTSPNNGPTPAPPTVVPGSTTQNNILALDDAEYNRNSILLIALVTPMAVILVGSLAGNVLMALKMRQGGAGGGGYNVRAGDVELSTSPRARVDV